MAHIRGFICRICGAHVTDERDQILEEYVLIDVNHKRREFNRSFGHICRACIPEARRRFLERGGKAAVRERIEQGALL